MMEEISFGVGKAIRLVCSVSVIIVFRVIGKLFVGVINDNEWFLKEV
jgi:hypothetical protein